MKRHVKVKKIIATILALLIVVNELNNDIQSNLSLVHATEYINSLSSSDNTVSGDESTVSEDENTTLENEETVSENDNTTLENEKTVSENDITVSDGDNETISGNDNTVSGDNNTDDEEYIEEDETLSKSLIMLASADTVTTYDIGKTSKTVYADYDSSDGSLVIRGTGTIGDDFSTKFNDIKTSIKSVVVSNTGISTPASCKSYFSDWSAVESIDISKLDTSNVTSMESMFYNCKSLTSLNISGINTSNVTTMESMFENCSSLATLDVSKFNTSNVKSLEYTFSSCMALESLDVSKWDTSSVTTLRGTFAYCNRLGNIDVSGWNVSKVTDFSSTFISCYEFTTLDISKWVNTNKASFINFAAYDSSIKTLKIGKITPTNLQSTFEGLTVLESVNLGTIDVTNVTNLRNFLAACTSLKEVDLSSWDLASYSGSDVIFNGSTNIEKIRTPKNMPNGLLNLPNYYMNNTDKNDTNAYSYFRGSTFSGSVELVLAVQYTVKHYKQNANGADEPYNNTNYYLAEREYIWALPNSTVTPAAKSYDNYYQPELQTVTVAADYSTVVEYYYKISNKYSISIPKNIKLEALNYANGQLEGTYKISVTGRLEDDKVLIVKPDSSFKMKTTNKDNITATITQDKIQWTNADMSSTETNIEGTIKISDITAGDWSGQFNFNIDVLDSVDVSVQSKEVVYDGNPVTCDLSVDSAEDLSNLVVTYSLDGETYTEEVPTFTDVGTYDVYYKAEADDHATSTGVVTITINKAESSIEVEPVGQKLSSTDSEQQLVTPGSSSTGTMVYKLNDGEYSESIPTATEAGTYTVYYKSIGDKNHKDSEEKSVTASITKSLTVPGLYDADNNLIVAWEDSGIDVTKDYSTSDKASNYYLTSETSSYYVITNDYPDTVRVVLPDTITTLGEDAFYGCNMLRVADTGTSLTTVGESAFYGCTSLEYLYLPATVTSVWYYGIGANADLRVFFAGTESATYKNGWRKAGDFDEYYNSVSSDDGTIRSTVLCQADRDNFTYWSTFDHRKDGEGTVEISDCVTYIPYKEFYGSEEITSVKIPQSVTVGNLAFANCTNLSDVQFVDNGGTSMILGAYAFANCTKITDIEFPDSLVTIGADAFQGCTGLTSLDIPDCVTTVGAYAFSGCENLERVKMPNNIDTIYSHTFENCISLNGLVIPDSVTYIDTGAFRNCTSLQSIDIPDSVTEIGISAFVGCGIKTINFSETSKLKTIDDGAFNECKLIYIDFPSSLTKIGTDVLTYCYDLKYVYVPSGIKTILGYALGANDDTVIYSNASKIQGGWVSTFNSMANTGTACKVKYNQSHELFVKTVDAYLATLGNN